MGHTADSQQRHNGAIVWSRVQTGRGDRGYPMQYVWRQVPAHSSRLDVGEEFKLPVAMHPWMVVSKTSLKLIVRLLREASDPASHPH